MHQKHDELVVLEDTHMMVLRLTVIGFAIPVRIYYKTPLEDGDYMEIIGMVDNLLLLGSSGFIGSHLLDALRVDSHYSIREFVGDITHEEDCVRNLRGMDMVVNTAALTYLPPSWDSPDAYTAVNYTGVMNLLRNHSMFKKFVQMSTSHVYGNQPYLPITQETFPLPDDPYSIAKFAADQAVRDYSKKHGFKALIIRPFNNYGPRQSAHFVIPTFCLSAIKDKKILVRGNTKREFIYVKDNVRAIKALLDNDVTGLVQIATGHNHTIADIANRIAHMADCPVGYGPDYRETDIQELLGSPASLLAHLPNFTFTSIDEGLKETYDYYKSQN